MIIKNMKEQAFRLGILLGFLSIGAFLIAYFTDNYIDKPWWLRITRTLLIIVVLAVAIISFKRVNNGKLSIKQAVLVGLKIALVAGIVGAIFNYLFTTVIEPEYINQLIEISEQEALKQNPTMPEEQMETMNKITSGLMQPWVLSIFTFLSMTLYGLVLSSILGLILKKNNSFNNEHS